MRCEQDKGRLFVLEDEEAEELLKQLWQWRLEDDRLVKEFLFPNFVSGFAFANKVAKFRIEQGKVEVSLSTESAGGLIKNDFIIAAKIDEIAKR
jgi:4a-hydroxytetrahydrobiopterin dehydratase